jgi:17beta-estradiol 17-dehydrogenase / very-long-chain 3-oxoacyl-CoA reductase
MTAICLPAMLRKKKGIVINNSSGSGRIPTPMLTVYSATKAYMDFFSQALSIEYREKGIIVQSLCPYYVSTKLSRVRKSFTTPTPDEFVASAIKTIGIQTVTNGCFVHNFQVI